MLELRGVGTRFGDNHVLKDATLDIVARIRRLAQKGRGAREEISAQTLGASA